MTWLIVTNAQKVECSLRYEQRSLETVPAKQIVGSVYNKLRFVSKLIFFLSTAVSKVANLYSDLDLDFYMFNRYLLSSDCVSFRCWEYRD